MKWFKHENTFNNAKIEMLTDKHGAIAYAVYFRTLELIASEIDESNPNDWGYLPELYTTQYLAKKLQVDEETLSEIFATCTQLDLWEVVSNRIYCPAILERCDDYTQRLLAQSRKKVGTKSEESPTKNRIEENRIDKKNTPTVGVTPLHRSIAYLKELPLEDVTNFSVTYQASKQQILDKAEGLALWCESKGKKPKDYRATLQGALLRDYGKRANDGYRTVKHETN